MSIEALNWSRKLTVGDAIAKAVLRHISDYADEDGRCWPSLRRIADEVEVSADTARRKLALLERRGILVRISTWEDDHGTRNHDRRGRQTADEIRLALTITQADILYADKEENSTGAPNCDTEPQEHAPPLAATGGGCATGGVASDTRGPLAVVPSHNEPSLNQESPPSPPSGGVEDKISPEARERWLRFKMAYPDGMTDPITAALEFYKLSESQQEQAIAAEPVYAARCRSRREKSAKAHLFLRKRTFEGILAAAPETPTAGGPYDPTSEAGKALITLAIIAKASLPRMSDGRIIYTKPITPQLLALATAPHERLRYEIGSNSFGAWRELIRAHLTNPPNLTEIEAPWPYPPSKDGKTYIATGPPTIPGTLMTQEDEKELAKL